MTTAVRKPPTSKSTKSTRSAARPAAALLDGRTESLTDDALACRGFNHLWVRQPIPPHQLAAMRDSGYMEVARLCNCGCEWVQVFDWATCEIVVSRRHYPAEGYKMPKGTGRLPKNEARRAYFAGMFHH